MCLKLDRVNFVCGMLLLLRISSTTASSTAPCELPSPASYSLLASHFAICWLTSSWCALCDVANATRIFKTIATYSNNRYQARTENAIHILESGACLSFDTIFKIEQDYLFVRMGWLKIDNFLVQMPSESCIISLFDENHMT